MKRVVIYALAVSLFLLTGGCVGKKTPAATVLEGFTQGTTFNIVIKGEVPEDISSQVDSLFLNMDNSMSLFNPSSLLSRINRGETDIVDAYIAECIRVAGKISIESGGAYDITIKPVTSAYGFTGDSTSKNINLDSLRQFVGYEKISLRGDRLVKEDPRVQIDLNSIAQGYTVDIIARHFDALGLNDYLIEMGGEIYAKGKNRSGHEWVIGIDKPIEGNSVSGENLQEMIAISGRGLATSGNYRKYYTDDSGRKVVHTIDAKSGEPVISNLLSVTVVADDATLADVYGTFFMIVGLERTLEFLKGRTDIDVYMIYSDEQGNMKTHATPGLKIMR